MRNGTELVTETLNKHIKTDWPRRQRLMCDVIRMGKRNQLSGRYEHIIERESKLMLP